MVPTWVLQAALAGLFGVGWWRAARLDHLGQVG
jgi:hypothetical protein